MIRYAVANLKTSFIRAIDVIVTRTSRGFQHVILVLSNFDINDPPIIIEHTELLVQACKNLSLQVVKVLEFFLGTLSLLVPCHGLALLIRADAVLINLLNYLFTHKAANHYMFSQLV